MFWKRTLAGILAVSLTMAPLAGSVGDVNADGTVNAADYVCLGALLGGNFTSALGGLAGADLNANGKLDVQDLVMLGRALVCPLPSVTGPDRSVVKPGEILTFGGSGFGCAADVMFSLGGVTLQALQVTDSRVDVVIPWLAAGEYTGQMRFNGNPGPSFPLTVQSPESTGLSQNEIAIRVAANMVDLNNTLGTLAGEFAGEGKQPLSDRFAVYAQLIASLADDINGLPPDQAEMVGKMLTAVGLISPPAQCKEALAGLTGKGESVAHPLHEQLFKTDNFNYLIFLIRGYAKSISVACWVAALRSGSAAKIAKVLTKMVYFCELFKQVTDCLPVDLRAIRLSGPTALTVGQSADLTFRGDFHPEQSVAQATFQSVMEKVLEKMGPDFEANGLGGELLSEEMGQINGWLVEMVGESGSLPETLSLTPNLDVDLDMAYYNYRFAHVLELWFPGLSSLAPALQALAAAVGIGEPGMPVHVENDSLSLSADYSRVTAIKPNGGNIVYHGFHYGIADWLVPWNQICSRLEVGDYNFSIVVVAGEKPVINSFSADPSSIQTGQSSVLSWSITGATSASIDHHVGNVNATSGYNSVSPISTSTYTLTAANASGETTKDVTITVASPCTGPGIGAHPASKAITSGQTATLTVTATGTAPLTYQWYQGDSPTATTPVGTNSPIFTTPALTATTSYWVKLTNACGAANSNTATVTVGGAGSLVATDLIVGNLRYVPAGTFTQGSPTTEAGRIGSEAQFIHTLTKNLAVMETEVTREMWVCLKLRQPQMLVADPTNPDYGSGTANPVQRSTWYEAVLFANVLSMQQGLTRCYYADAAFTTPITGANFNIGPFYCDWNANGYRLPAEGEWEYFCRAGTKGPFSVSEPNYDSHTCSDCAPSPTLTALDSVAWWCGNAGSTTHAVGTKATNPWNLKDLHGNVSEWCWDWYGNYPSGSATDYRGESEGSSRVARGGNWYYQPRFCRAAMRIYNEPYDRYEYLGFRLVRSLPR